MKKKTPLKKNYQIRTFTIDPEVDELLCWYRNKSAEVNWALRKYFKLPEKPESGWAKTK